MGDTEDISATSEACGPGYIKKHLRPPWFSCSCSLGSSSGSGNSFPTNLITFLRLSSKSGPVQRDRFSSLGCVKRTIWVSVSTNSLGRASQRQTLRGRWQFGQFRPSASCSGPASTCAGLQWHLVPRLCQIGQNLFTTPWQVPIDKPSTNGELDDVQVDLGTALQGTSRCGWPSGGTTQRMA